MWFRVDDKLHSHPKTLAAGNEAMGLWVRLGAWCGDHLTDGKIPHVVVELFDREGAATKGLVLAGWLRESGADGYEMHNYLEYNPSKKSVESLRKKRVKSGSKGGSKSQAKAKQVLEQVLEQNASKTGAKGTGTGTGTGTGVKKEMVQAVFDAWQVATGHPSAILDDKRKRRIKARLHEGFTVDDLILAIAHRHHDPWLMGKGNSPRVFDDLETLLRDAAQVERLRDLERPIPVKATGSTYGPEAVRAREQREADEYKGWSLKKMVADDDQ